VLSAAVPVIGAAVLNYYHRRTTQNTPTLQSIIAFCRRHNSEMFSFEWMWRSFRNNRRINQKVSQVRSCCSQWPLACWDCGFESHRGHGCLSVAECCALSGRSPCIGPITCPEESYRLWCVVRCDLETSWMRKPWPTGGGGVCWAKIKKYVHYIYIYISCFAFYPRHYIYLPIFFLFPSTLAIVG